MNNKTIYIETYGCSSNQADSQIMINLLEKGGYKVTDDETDADYLIMNTCAVKHKTEEKIIYKLKDLSKLNKKVIIAGCLTKVNPERIKKVLPNFAGMLDPNSIYDIVNMFKEIENGNKGITKTSNVPKFLSTGSSAKNFVKVINISWGCLSRCSFCATKLARGNLVSYKIGDIKRDFEKAVNDGYKTIHLSSQDTGCYGFDVKTNLTELLDELTTIQGDYKIRVGMMNPWHVIKILPSLIHSYKSDKIQKFLHVPVQSGSERILKHMLRVHTVNNFKLIVNEFRKNFTDIDIATDVIVGYPLEDENDFQSTYSLIEEIKPEVLNISMFSSRKGTKASLLKQLPTEIVRKRSTLMFNLYKSYRRN